MKYTSEFKEKALAMVRDKGIMETCRELKVAHCTIRRWCREIEGVQIIDDQENNAELETVAATNESAQAEECLQDEEVISEPQETVATAMALLVIENMNLRETIRRLRATISGLTDNVL